jgi:hypothetical protein
MTDLSPAAQVAMDAALTHLGPAFEPLVRKMLASALRAAADQVVPPNGSRKNNEIRSELLAIAAELDNTFQLS